MASINEMMLDLEQADKAGDAELANHIASLIKQEQAQPAPVIAPQAEPVPEDNGFSVLNMMMNGPKSTYNVAKDVASGAWNAINHPVETAKGVRDIGQGLYSYHTEAMARNPAGPSNAPYMDKRPAVDAMRDGITQKYQNGFLPALENDPAGVLMDASMVVPAVAGLKGPATLNPVSQGFNAVRAGKEAALPAVGRKLYESTAKLGTTLTRDDRKRMVNTALDNDIPPTQAGVQKLDELAGGLHTKIDDLIDKATESDRAVPVDAVFKHLDDLRKEKGGVKIDSKEDLEAIDRYAKKLRDVADEAGKSYYSAADLQSIKRDLYEKINWKAKRMTDTPIEEGIYKSLAQGAKEGVEGIVPESSALNAEWGKLLELKPELQRAANRIENRDVVSLSSIPLMMGGAIAGDLKGALAGLSLSAILHPKVSGNLAVGMNKAGRRGKVVNALADNPNVARAEYVSYTAADRKEEREKKKRKKKKNKGIYN